jgi:hypothetical protein
MGPRDDVAGGELSPLENPDPGLYGDPPLFGPPFVRFVVDEFAALRRHLARLGDRLEPKDRAWSAVRTGNVDANGNATVFILEVPESYELFLHRVYVTAGAATFSSGITGGNVSVQVDDGEEDGADLTTVGLPIVLTWSSSAAVVAQPGQRVKIVLSGLGATAKSTAATVRCRGRLVRSRLSADEP